MNLKEISREIMRQRHLASLLGMDFLDIEGEEVCQAKMPVDERTKQPYGYLSGGATIALAETLAGAGSAVLCPGFAAFGVNVSASHINAAKEGSTVTATARLIKRGKRLHIWTVDVVDQDGMPVSVVQVTNYLRNIEGILDA